MSSMVRFNLLTLIKSATQFDSGEDNLCLIKTLKTFDIIEKSF